MKRDVARCRTSEGEGETTELEKSELQRFPSQKGSGPQG